MTVSVDNFAYGAVTPVGALLAACAGGAIGARCARRAMSLPRGERLGWLSLSAVATGTGAFTMHLGAMAGFAAGGLGLGYDLLTVCAALAVAVLFAGLGTALVSRSGPTAGALLGGGLLGAAGLAALHFLVLESLRMPAAVVQEPLYGAGATVLALAASFLGLWFTARSRSSRPGLVAGLTFGTGATVAHYVAMLGVHLETRTGVSALGDISTLLPLTVLATLVLLIIGLFTGLEPVMERDSEQEWGTRPGERTGEKLEWTPFESR